VAKRLVVCAWSNRFVNVPIPLVIEQRRCLDPAGEEWQRVLEATRQRTLMGAAG